MAEQTSPVPGPLLWEEEVPGGNHWSGTVRRGTTLRFTDLAGGANCSVLMFNRDQPLERYNMADTLKAQHTARLTRGHVCYSDMGRVLCSVAEDSVGWHDPIGGISDAASVRARYGVARFQEARNAMFRNGRDGLLIELGKYGLGKRDLVPPLNLFSRVVVNERGELVFVTGHSKTGDYVDLRFEMHALVVLSTAPHPLDPSPDYRPGPVWISAYQSGTAPKDDPCRLSCPENGRGFANTERLYRGFEEVAA